MALHPSRIAIGIAIATLVMAAAGCSGEPSRTPTGTSSPTGPAPVPSPTLSLAASAPASGSLLPDGAWQVQLSEAELRAQGADLGAEPPGVYTWTFDGSRARVTVAHEGKVDVCSAEASRTPRGVLLQYLGYLGCGGWTDTIDWSIEADGLHLRLVDSTAPRYQNAPYLEAKPWQRVAPQPIPSWPVWAVRCEPNCHGPVSGSFVSTGFLPGLGLTLPGHGEWFNTRDDEDEIELDLDDTALRLWRNPRPASHDGEPIASVGSSVADLTRWFASDPDMVVSPATTVALGGGLTATTFTMAVSDRNVNVDPDCPAGVRSCLNVLWVADGHVFAIGYGSAERLYFVTLASGDVLVVSVDAPDQATLERVQPAVDGIVSTLVIPAGS